MHIRSRRMDERRRELVFVVDTDEIIKGIALPAAYKVCGRCGGTGRHLTPSLEHECITASEWNEEWDKKEREAYMHGGYDVTCLDCKGKRVVSVVDEDNLLREQRDDYCLIQQAEDDERMREAEYETERRMGC